MDTHPFNMTTSSADQIPQDNTTTFLVGFGILLIFVLIGIIASAFLCITLKKDQYLWQSAGETRLQEKRRSDVVDGEAATGNRERDKVGSDENEKDDAPSSIYNG